MPNYSLVLDTKFKPFSYSEMLAPVLAATQAHQAVEEEYGSLAQKASVWDKMANELTDPLAYRMYKTYSDDLESRAEDLMRNGLNAASRKGMLDMRARYSKEIVPIETAYRRREELAAELRKAMASNPTMLYQRMAGLMSLDDFIKDPSLDYGNQYSGALLTQQVASAASNIAKEAGDSEEGRRKLRKILPYLYEMVLQNGFSREAVMKAILNSPDADKILTGLVDDAIGTSGVGRINSKGELDGEGWGDLYTRKRAYDYARLGLYNAIGATLYQIVTDQNALQHRRQVEADAAFRAALSRANAGNLPIDIHHLVSPNQLGEQGAKMVELLRAKLGLAKTYDGKTAKWRTTIDLSNLVVGRSDMYTYTFSNSSGGTTVKLFNSKGELLNRDSVVRQGGSNASKKALGQWYDSMYSTLTTNFKADKNGRWTTNSILSQMNDITAGKGALTMGAMRINFGADNNKKALETLLPGLTSGDKTQIYEITSFDANGNITRGKRASTKDFLDDEGNSKSTPMFYAAPNANTDGLIMQFNGKMYLIPRNKLGSLGELVYGINIPELQRANQLKLALIQQYGSDAYYGSEEGRELELTIDNYGAAYLRAAGTALGYSYEPPKYGLKASNQTEI